MAKTIESGHGQAVRAVLTGLALAAQVFWGPEEELCQDMVRGSFRDDLAALAPFLDPPGQEAALKMATLVQYRSWEGLCDRLEDQYLRLFVTSEDGLKAPLYHSHYETTDGSLMGRPYAMMRQRLEAAGIDPTGPANEPADHLALETEYLFFVLEDGWLRQDRELLAQGLEFAAREMLPWVWELARRLEQEEPGGFYAASAWFLVSLLTALPQAFPAKPAAEKP